MHKSQQSTCLPAQHLSYQWESFLPARGYQKQASQVAGVVGKEGFPEQAVHSRFSKLSALGHPGWISAAAAVCKGLGSGEDLLPASLTASLWPCPHVVGKGATVPKVPGIRALIPFV